MEHSRRIAIGIVAFLATIFVLLSVYLFVHDQKLDYLLYLYGDDLRTSPRLLLRLLSKDGHLVRTARIAVDGTPIEGVLLDTTRPFREITASIGEKTYRYEITFSELIERRTAPPTDDWFTAQELEAARAAVEAMKRSPRRLYVLPETMRMFGESDNRVTVICMTDTGPCRDEEVTIDGVPVLLLNGIGEAVLPLPIARQAVARFVDGSSMDLPYPYVGRMFSLTREGEHLVLRTLVETHNVHVDCWRGGKWLFTDVVTGQPNGETLPAGYDTCDRIQVSFDSAGPNGNFLVWTRETALESDVADPYYRSLLDDLMRYRQDLVPLLLSRYPACRFHRLAVFLSGDEQEKRFEERKRSQLTVVWWILSAVILSGLTAFGLLLWRRMSIVENQAPGDEEPVVVTLSRRRQRIIAATIVAGVASFFVLLLVLLRNLA